MDYVPECYQKATIILGCGSTLFGDDGFGPAVIDYLEKHCRVPEHVAIMDVGTGAREVLFTISLTEKKPERVIIIDAVDCRKKPGEIFAIPIDDLPEKKINDFSLHQLPTSNLLKELKDFCNVEVILLAAQPECVPETVKPGLSKTLQEAVPRIGKYIERRYF
jgi:coenzyme F420 hydrogenase subunit delta